jgi:hypothetical protein
MSVLTTETALQAADERRMLRRMIAEESTPCAEASWSSLGWSVYFRVNRTRLMRIPWERGAELTAKEAEVLIPSIQDFQLGESTDGVNAREMARLYAERSGDVTYIDAMRLFIAEEQRHGAYLGRFLDLAGAPRLSFSWTDWVFRRLRKRTGLEMMLVTALMAELIAKVYYRALYAASSSVVLRRICAQLLRDERKHVEFHVERLRLIRRRRAGWRRVLTGAGQRVLFTGTCLAVWKRHGAAMRLGGFGFRRFWRCAWAEYRKALA